MSVDSEQRNRLRVAIAEYEHHISRGPLEQDPDANWWYAAWAEALVPVLKQLCEASQ